MRKRIDLEYAASSSRNILFKRLATPDGLAEWFADDVNIEGDLFIFSWEGEIQKARVIELVKNEKIRFQWEEDEGEEYYFEFSLRTDPMTNEMALWIVDYVDEDEEEDATELWDKQVESLFAVLGI
ncbi:SRPBCC domain-containing protein [Marinilabiliaceae bacterium JC040]|nr:SRPBCC domain-containing protein [Marinilabiliaceae bacterium JC040]